ncbi:MAG TPA: hypothetical protein ENH62_08320 [Marinobacter sp.]|uniref:Uncharacterized protein n=1 Tax=marine sediment metagenome TaxID=412755 RepID=A0A0F9R3U5_9ZZZZ|nr:hypothetical protein [Marinobacter sp.]
MPRKKNPKDLIKGAVAESHDLELAKAKTEAAKWRRQCKEATKTAVEMEARADMLVGLPDMPSIQKFKPSKKAKAGTVAAVVPASDWHVEERVFWASVSGKNRFNLRIAEARIKTFYQKVLEMIEWQNYQAPVSEIWYPQLGDLLSGYIHEELLETNTLSPTEACVFLQEMICSGIDLWLRETKLPIYIPTCCGNHARTTAKKRIKTNHRNSFEWLLYMTLAKYYASEPRVTWLIGEGYWNIQTIMGRKVRFHHGDGLRFLGGVGGITIPVNKAIDKWQKITACDFDIFGHWHQYLYHYPSWVSCGCLIGYSEYALEVCKAEFQHPTQTFIVIDRGLGISLCTPIYLEKPKRGRKK